MYFQFGFSHGFVVGRRGLGGGLTLYWREDIDISILDYLQGHISVIVTDWKLGQMNFLPDFYDNPESHLRLQSWDLMRRIAPPTMGTLWLLFGDFNEALLVDEFQGSVVRPILQMALFWADDLCTLNSCGSKRIFV